jgi:hypothetical protein
VDATYRSQRPGMVRRGGLALDLRGLKIGPGKVDGWLLEVVLLCSKCLQRGEEPGDSRRVLSRAPISGLCGFRVLDPWGQEVGLHTGHPFPR